MRGKRSIRAKFKLSSLAVAAFLSLEVFAAGPLNAQDDAPDSATENYRGELGVMMAMVREELIGVPNYDVFDWIEAEVFDDGRVVLDGAVVNPTTKEYATTRIEQLDNVTEVVNRIDVLPLSSGDDQIRLTVYNAIYGPDSPLFRFAGRTLPPVHIVVDRGNVTLKGTVDAQVDRQFIMAETRSVPGVFDVENDIQVESGA